GLLVFHVAEYFIGRGHAVGQLVGNFELYLRCEVVSRCQSIAQLIHPVVLIRPVLVALVDVFQKQGGAPQVFDVIVISEAHHIFIGLLCTLIIGIGWVKRIAAFSPERGEIVVERKGMLFSKSIVDRGSSKPLVVAVFV